MDDLVKYINEDSVRGELAREFSEIVSDYHNGKITMEEKNDLTDAIVAGFKASQVTSDEEVMRWVANVSKVVIAVV